MTESTGSTSTIDVFFALIADWNQAVVANDPDAIAAFAEPDWVFVGENGTFPGEQFLEAVAKGQVSHDFMTSEVHDVRVYGDVAIVIARVRNRGEFKRATRSRSMSGPPTCSSVVAIGGAARSLTSPRSRLPPQPRRRSGRAGLIGRQNSRVSEVALRRPIAGPRYGTPAGKPPGISGAAERSAYRQVQIHHRKPVLLGHGAVATDRCGRCR